MFVPARDLTAFLMPALLLLLMVGRAAFALLLVLNIWWHSKSDTVLRNKPDVPQYEIKFQLPGVERSPCGSMRKWKSTT